MYTATYNQASASFLSSNLHRPNLEVLDADLLWQINQNSIEKRDYILRFESESNLDAESFDELLQFLHKTTIKGARTYLVGLPCNIERALSQGHAHLNYSVLVNFH